MELLQKNDLISFNEGVTINFEPIGHMYNYNGTILKGATSKIKDYIVPFESESVAEICERNWQVPKSTILKAWEMSGEVASTFGTSIHLALEFYDLYRRYKKKNGENCFRLKHPLLEKIVIEFYEMAKGLKIKGKSYSEALISNVNLGYSALVDKLIVTDAEKKECILCDYKIQHHFLELGTVEFQNIPFEIELPNNKLSKLALQLRFQEQLLNLSGWTVVKKLGFVYESEWQFYIVPDLKELNII